MRLKRRVKMADLNFDEEDFKENYNQQNNNQQNNDQQSKKQQNNVQQNNDMDLNFDAEDFTPGQYSPSFDTPAEFEIPSIDLGEIYKGVKGGFQTFGENMGKIQNLLTGGTAQMGGGIAKTGDMFNELIRQEEVDTVFDDFAEKSFNISKESFAKGEWYPDQKIMKDIKQGNIKDAVGKAVQGAIKNIPQLASMQLMGGIAGVAGPVTQGVGSLLGQTSITPALTKIPLIFLSASATGQNYQNLEDRDDISINKKVASSIGHGAIEFATESMGTMRWAGELAKSNPVADRALKNQLHNWAKYMVLNTGERGLDEFSEEVVAGISGDLYDYALGISDKSFYEILTSYDEYFNEGIPAFLSAGGMSAGTTFQNAMAMRQQNQQVKDRRVKADQLVNWLRDIHPFNFDEQALEKVREDALYREKPEALRYHFQDVANKIEKYQGITIDEASELFNNMVTQNVDIQEVLPGILEGKPEQLEPGETEIPEQTEDETTIKPTQELLSDLFIDDETIIDNQIIGEDGKITYQPMEELKNIQRGYGNPENSIFTDETQSEFTTEFKQTLAKYIKDKIDIQENFVQGSTNTYQQLLSGLEQDLGETIQESTQAEGGQLDFDAEDFVPETSFEYEQEISEEEQAGLENMINNINRKLQENGIDNRIDVKVVNEVKADLTNELLQEHDIREGEEPQVEGRINIENVDNKLNSVIEVALSPDKPVTETVIHETAEMWLEMYKQSDPDRFQALKDNIIERADKDDVSDDEAREFMARSLTDNMLSQQTQDQQSQSFIQTVVSKFKEYFKKLMKRLRYYNEQVYPNQPTELKEQADRFANEEWDYIATEAQKADEFMAERYAIQNKPFQYKNQVIDFIDQHYNNNVPLQELPGKLMQLEGVNKNALEEFGILDLLNSENDVLSKEAVKGYLEAYSPEFKITQLDSNISPELKELKEDIEIDLMQNYEIPWIDGVVEDFNKTLETVIPAISMDFADFHLFIPKTEVKEPLTKELDKTFSNLSQDDVRDSTKADSRQELNNETQKRLYNIINKSKFDNRQEWAKFIKFYNNVKINTGRADLLQVVFNSLTSKKFEYDENIQNPNRIFFDENNNFKPNLAKDMLKRVARMRNALDDGQQTVMEEVIGGKKISDEEVESLIDDYVEQIDKFLNEMPNKELEVRQKIIDKYNNVVKNNYIGQNQVENIINPKMWNEHNSPNYDSEIVRLTTELIEETPQNSSIDWAETVPIEQWQSIKGIVENFTEVAPKIEEYFKTVHRMENTDNTKYVNYTLRHRGEEYENNNYREVLLRLKEGVIEHRGHFSEQPNVLYHMRIRDALSKTQEQYEQDAVNDKFADRTLFLEEVQSDYLQEKGNIYPFKLPEQVISELNKEIDNVRPVISNLAHFFKITNGMTYEQIQNELNKLIDRNSLELFTILSEDAQSTLKDWILQKAPVRDIETVEKRFKRRFSNKKWRKIRENIIERGVIETQNGKEVFGPLYQLGNNIEQGLRELRGEREGRRFSEGLSAEHLQFLRDNTPNQHNPLAREFWGQEGEIGQYRNVLGREAWKSLAWRHALRLATEEGYDRLAWTLPAQQAERFLDSWEDFYENIYFKDANKYLAKEFERAGLNYRDFTDFVITGYEDTLPEGPDYSFAEFKDKILNQYYEVDYQEQLGSGDTNVYTDEIQADSVEEARSEFKDLYPDAIINNIREIKAGGQGDQMGYYMNLSVEIPEQLREKFAQEDISLYDIRTNDADVILRQYNEWFPAEQVQPVDVGNENVGFTSDNTVSHEYEYQLLDIQDIMASYHFNDNTLNAVKTEGFPKFAQPRLARGEKLDASELRRKLLTIKQRGLNPKLWLIQNNPMLSEGSPVVWNYNNRPIVVVGNNRFNLIDHLYRNNRGEEYKEVLKENAEKVGIDPAQIDNMDKPIIVRKLSDDVIDEDIEKLAFEGNKEGKEKMDYQSLSMQLSEYIDNSFIGMLDAESSITSQKNSDAVANFLQDLGPAFQNLVKPSPDRSRTGVELTQEGERVIEMAMFAKVYESPDLINEYYERTDSTMKTILKSLIEVTPRMVKAKNILQNSDVETQRYDISENLANATEIYRNYQNNKYNKSTGEVQYETVDDYIEFHYEGQSLTGQLEASQLDLALAKFMGSDFYKRSYKRISGVLDVYLDTINNIVENAKNQSMFDVEQPGPQELIKKSIESFEQAWEAEHSTTAPGQSEMFAKTDTTGPYDNYILSRAVSKVSEINDFDPAEKMNAEDKAELEPININRINDHIFNNILPFRKDRLPFGTAGAYYPAQDRVSLTREHMNNFDTMLHEVGHYYTHELNLDAGKYTRQGLFSTMVQSNEQRGRDFPWKAYEASEIPGEVSAEYFIIYLSNPVMARKLHEGYYQYINQKLSENPEMKQNIVDLQKMMRRWDSMSDVEKTRNVIDKEGRTYKSQIITTTDRIVQKIFNDLYPIKKAGEYLMEKGDLYEYDVSDYDNKTPEELDAEGGVSLEENPYRIALDGQARLHPNIKAFTKTGQIDPYTFDIVGPSFNDILSEVEDYIGTSKTVGDFEAYWVAKHALERMEKGKLWAGEEGPVSEQQLRNTVDELYQPGFDVAIDKFQSFFDTILQWQVYFEMIDQKTKELISDYYEFYIPLNRTVDNGGQSSAGKRLVNLPSVVQQAIGSNEAFASPIGNIWENIVDTFRVGHKNKVMASLVKLQQRVPGGGEVLAIKRNLSQQQVEPNRVKAVINQLHSEGQLTNVEKQSLLQDLNNEETAPRVMKLFKNVVYQQNDLQMGDHEYLVRINGQKYIVEINDPAIEEAVTGLDTNNFQNEGTFLAGVRKVTSMMKTGAVIHPYFWIKNLVARDPFTSATFAEGMRGTGKEGALKNFNPIIDPLRGLIETFGDAKDTDSYKTLFEISGGSRSGIVADMIRKAEQGDFSAEELLKTKDMKFYKKVMNAMGLPVRLLENMAQRSEDSSRLGYFKKHLDNAELDKMSPRQRRLFILEIAEEARGEININYRTKGSWARQADVHAYPFLTAQLNNMRMVYNKMKNPKTAVKFLLKGIIYHTIPNLLLWFWNRDKEEYQQLPAWRKFGFKNLVLENQIGPIKTVSVPNLYSAPIAFFDEIMFGKSAEFIANAIYQQDNDFGEDLSGFLKQAWGQSLPTNFIPHIATPVYELISNKDLFTNNPWLPYNERGLHPTQQYGPYTSELAKDLSNFINNTPGLNKLGKATSPRYIEQQVENLLSTSGKSILNLYGLFFGGEGAKEYLQKDFPIKQPTMIQTQAVNEFYNKLDHSRKVIKSFEKTQERNRQSQERSEPKYSRREYQEAKRAYSILQSTNQSMAPIRQQMKQIDRNDNIPDERKEKILYDYRKQIVDRAKNALNAIGE